MEARLRTKVPAPPPQDLRSVIQQLSAVVVSAEERASWDRRDYVERCHELQEARQMAGSGPWLAQEARGSINTPGATLRESGISSQGATGDLDLMLNNVEWRREINLSWLEFSRWGIQQIILISRLYYIKNPLIRRLLDVDATYVFGRDVEMSSEDPSVNDAIKGILEMNNSELGHCALVEHQKRTNYDGNLFFIFFPDTQDTGTVPIRTIDATEIQDVITNPDDTNEAWYFRRVWTARTFDPVNGVTSQKSATEWYPAVGFDPEKMTPPQPKPVQINGYPVNWGSPIMHRRYGAVGRWLFGCPRIYPALDWAKADRRYLEACATLAASLAQVALSITSKGGALALAGIKQQLETTVGPNSAIWDQNPSAVNASVFATTPGTTLSAFQSRGQGLDPAEHRHFAMMAAIVIGVPPTWAGEMETANLATATTLDRPTELGFQNKQEEWRELLSGILMYSLNVQLRAPSGKLRESLEARGIDVQEVRLMERPRVRQPDGRMMYITEAQRKTPKKPTDLEISVQFPPIREGDLPALMGALVEAITLNGFEPTGIDEREGIKAALSLVNSFSNTNIDVDEVIEKMYPAKTYDPLMDRTPLIKAQTDAALNPPAPVAPTAQNGNEIPGIGAVPHPPGARKPHPKKINATVENALTRLGHAADKMRKLVEGRKAA